MTTCHERLRDQTLVSDIELTRIVRHYAMLPNREKGTLQNEAAEHMTTHDATARDAMIVVTRKHRMLHGEEYRLHSRVKKWARNLLSGER